MLCRESESCLYLYEINLALHSETHGCANR